MLLLLFLLLLLLSILDRILTMGNSYSLSGMVSSKRNAPIAARTSIGTVLSMTD